jgi:hypothetical protein
MSSLSDELDRIEEEYGWAPMKIACDGGCGTKLTRHDERYSQKTGECQMVMLLCPQCAKDAGWINE